MRRFIAISVAIAALLFSINSANAASPEDMRRLTSLMCDVEKKVWTAPEWVESRLEKDVAYDEHFTVCAVQFVDGGRWYSIQLNERRQVSRRFGWSEATRELIVLMIDVDAIDATNSQPFITRVMSDREVRGSATYASRSTFRGAKAFDHFYLPPSQTLGDEPCFYPDVCKAKGLALTSMWQQEYDTSLARTLEYLRGRSPQLAQIQ